MAKPHGLIPIPGVNIPLIGGPTAPIMNCPEYVSYNLKRGYNKKANVNFSIYTGN
jgi:hypothetical protein